MEEKSDNNYEISLHNVESIKELKKTFVNLNKKNKIKCNKIVIINFIYIFNRIIIIIVFNTFH